MMRNFEEAVVNRRTNYAIDKKVIVSPEDIIKTVENLTQNVPSAFNSQSARVVVLFGKHHNKVWDIVKETLRKIVPSANFQTVVE